MSVATGEKEAEHTTKKHQTHSAHNTHNDEKPSLLTVHEIAQQLRVDDTTVRRWIKNGVLDAITLPHRGKRQAYRIRQATLQDLVNNPAVATE